MRRRIYVSGPLGSHPAHNAAAAIRAAVVLREMGFTPIVPHLFVLADMVSPHDDAFWLAWCLDLIEARAVDAVYVYGDGRSPGTEAELDRARALGIPVFRDTVQLMRWAADMEDGCGRP